MMTNSPWLPGLMALLGAAMAIAGARMMRGPEGFLSTGLPPATDPRTIRFFGLVQLVGGILLAAFALYGLVLRRQVG